MILELLHELGHQPLLVCDFSLSPEPTAADICRSADGQHLHRPFSKDLMEP